ncbi:hypothetical protein HJG60_009563 [Phyllostomus discolor]|uniref:Secreted protein n=1 Tax=Phyllostomus discolor TaxID=89673 RepID=A0A833YFD1_9CHIR|nr:hypothetical protein HJG60_009563 [Phyllostomus discolor]
MEIADLAFFCVLKCVHVLIALESTIAPWEELSEEPIPCVPTLVCLTQFTTVRSAWTEHLPCLTVVLVTRNRLRGGQAPQDHSAAGLSVTATGGWHGTSPRESHCDPQAAAAAPQLGSICV